MAQLTARTHRNVAAVALANKLARMAWAVLARNEVYRPQVLAATAAALNPALSKPVIGKGWAVGNHLLTSTVRPFRD